MSDNLFASLFEDKKSIIMKRKKRGENKTNNTARPNLTTPPTEPKGKNKPEAKDPKVKEKPKQVAKGKDIRKEDPKVQEKPKDLPNSNPKKDKKRKIEEPAPGDPPKRQKIIVNPPNVSYDKETEPEEDNDPETLQPESDIEEDWKEEGEAEFFDNPEDNEDPSLLSDVKSFMSGTNYSEFTPEDEDEEEDRNQKRRNMGGGGKCTLLMGGILVGTPRREIRELFQQYGIGCIRDVRILFNKDNTKTTCCAFVDLTRKSDAMKAIEKLNGTPYKGKKLDVKMVDNQTTPRGYALYIKNLSFKTTKEKLKEVFSECGEIIDIRLPVHEDTGKPKGQAWIEFKTAEARQTARQKDRIKVDGRQLLLSNANDKNFVLL